jgi:hypothetical protein
VYEGPSAAEPQPKESEYFRRDAKAQRKRNSMFRTSRLGVLAGETPMEQLERLERLELPLPRSSCLAFSDQFS